MTLTQAPYSYRYDPAVPKFDDSQPLLIFDGLCVLCSSGVQWMLARDPNGKSRFAVIQAPLPQALYAHYGLDAERFDTFMVLSNGVAHVKWRGVLAAARSLPAPWGWLGQMGRIVPPLLGDPVYDVVQRNRLAWFGSRQTCYAPDAAVRQRFAA
jgi:predicted DCC family thiol-disulfide oxidoreductase YuxK